MAKQAVTFEVDGVDFWCYDGEKYAPGQPHEVQADRDFLAAIAAAEAVGVLKASTSQEGREHMNTVVQPEKESQKLNDLAWKARHSVRKEIEEGIADPDTPMTAETLVHEAKEFGHILAEEEAAQAALEEAI